jgi:hypothetical protein
MHIASRIVALVCSACFVLMMSACSGIMVRDAGYGPPPHAPAHGYRAKTSHGVRIRFDSHLGVYVVLDIPDRYYYKGVYFSYRKGKWFSSNHPDGPWKKYSKKALPPGLYKKYHGGKKPGKGDKKKSQ